MKDIPRAQVGIIGGSGLYEMPGIQGAKEIRVKTPFGAHSGPIVLGTLSGVACAFLPRHGQGHVLTPSELNNRANIYALKSLGADRVIAVAAVGSLKEELAPRHFVFPDQLMDRTKGRISTFFGEGVVAHVAFDTPFCEEQSSLLYGSAHCLGIPCHKGGVYAAMEGPAFSTRAESEYHRKMGYSLIGMTVSQEAKLAREAELCYSLIALVTDYDCWKEGEEVSTGKVIENLMANIANAQRLLQQTLPAIAERNRRCRCAAALRGAIFTSQKFMNPRTVKKLNLLIGRTLQAEKR